MTERFEQIRDIVLGARDLPPGDRVAWIAEACAGDDGLRTEVESLLAHETSDDERVRTAGAVAPGWAAGIGERESIGSWEILEKIGESDRSRVYRARRPRPADGEVAVELFAPEAEEGADSESVLARLDAARAALDRCARGGIARLLDHGTTAAGEPFVVSEFVRGSPILEYADRANLTVRDRVELIRDAADALEQAHEQGVAHGRLGPSRVIVARESGAAIPRIVGFGGTGGPFRAEADVRALGELLFEILTSTAPADELTPPSASTDGPEAEDRARRRRTTPARWRRNLEGDLDRIALGCLTVTSPDALSAVAADLSAWLDRSPARGSTSGFGSRLARLLRRRPEHRG